MRHQNAWANRTLQVSVTARFSPQETRGVKMAAGSHAPFANIFTLLVGLMQISDHFLSQCDALRMINLDAPQMALQGDTIQLSCSYSLITSTNSQSPRAGGNSNSNPHKRHSNFLDRLTAGAGSNVTKRSVDAPAKTAPDKFELVYAVKWYRDEREFFRYLTQDWPHKQAFPAEGLNIDVDKSDNQTVILRNVSLKTSGLFRCEVSTDAPSFLTKSIERKLFIYHLPSEGPTVEQVNKTGLLYLDDQLLFKCSSRESKPASQIDWIINETLNLTNRKPPDSPQSVATGRSSPVSIQVTTHRFARLPSPPTRLDQSQRSQKLIEIMPEGQHMPLSANTTSMSISQRDEEEQLAISNSLHQLLETSISWLNLTVDANLLQYLSSAAAFSDKPASEFSWTRRKIASGTPVSNHLTSTNPTALNVLSQGSAPSKTRRRNGNVRGGDTSAPQQQKAAPISASRLQLKVRCVARTMHLSLSDDVRLKVVAKTREVVDQENLALSARRDKPQQAKSSASDISLSWAFARNVVSFFILHTIYHRFVQSNGRHLVL